MKTGRAFWPLPPLASLRGGIIGQGVENLALVLGPIAAQAVHGHLDVPQQRLHLPRVILAIGGQGLRDHFAGGLVDR